MWLSDIDGQLVTSKPVGGLPETAREQLQRFMEVYNELDSNRHKVESVLQQGQDYLKRSTDGASSGIQHSLRTLKQKWDSAMNKANDRKVCKILRFSLKANFLFSFNELTEIFFLDQT